MMKAINLLSTKLQIGKIYVMEEFKSVQDTQERMFIPSLNIFILSINLHIFNYIFTSIQFQDWVLSYKEENSIPHHLVQESHEPETHIHWSGINSYCIELLMTESDKQ